MASIFFMMVSSTVIGPRRDAEGVDPEPIAPTDSRQLPELHTACQSHHIENGLFFQGSRPRDCRAGANPAAGRRSRATA